MRPKGEVSVALLDAARELWTAEQAPTLLEMAHRAGVAMGAARIAVASLRKRGDLEIVRERKVDGRNRKCAEYAVPRGTSRGAEASELVRACSLWVQR